MSLRLATSSVGVDGSLVQRATKRGATGMGRLGLIELHAASLGLVSYEHVVIFKCRAPSRLLSLTHCICKHERMCGV